MKYTYIVGNILSSTQKDIILTSFVKIFSPKSVSVCQCADKTHTHILTCTWYYGLRQQKIGYTVDVLFPEAVIKLLMDKVQVDFAMVCNDVMF